jgi:hypothetical protein
MLNPGDRVTIKELYLLLRALKMTREFLMTGENKSSVSLALDEALEVFKPMKEDQSA